MRKISFTIAAPLFMLLVAVAPVLAQSPQKEQERAQWIVDSLKEIQAVKVGMTRADLLKVFTTEGGLSTRLRRTYVYRKCPYIKVDVEFTAVGRPARDADGRVTLSEADGDVIKTISRPYLALMVAD